jgi:hypothetical protein
MLMKEVKTYTMKTTYQSKKRSKKTLEDRRTSHVSWIAKPVLRKEQHWQYHNTWLQTILQSHSNKNSMVLAHTHTQNRFKGDVTEQNSQTKTHVVTVIWFSTKLSKICVGEKTASSTNGARKSGYPPVEDWKWIPVSHLLLVPIQSRSRILM